MKVFLDANILFSAAMKGSVVNKTIKALGRELDFVTSEYAFEEARRNLANKAPESSSELDLLGAFITRDDKTAPVQDGLLPEKDKPILGAAMGAGCARLVTGDTRHFKRLFDSEIGGVKIVSLTGLVRELDEAGRLPPIELG